VFRAYDAERERLVAVKLFRLDLPPERVHQLVDAFERLIAAELNHPSLAAPLAAGIAGASAYLAVEYVGAESLDLAVREYGPAPAQDAVRVITELAAALDFAAAVKVVHGAMHPRDVLLSADETRITGAGIAKALERAGVSAPLRRPYTAPERLAGGSWDRRADVFTLAALSHELLWGRRIAGTGAHVAGALTGLTGADLASLQDAFARALADDPVDRFATALEFAEAVRAAFVLRGGEDDPRKDHDQHEDRKEDAERHGEREEVQREARRENDQRVERKDDDQRKGRRDDQQPKERTENEPVVVLPAVARSAEQPRVVPPRSAPIVEAARPDAPRPQPTVSDLALRAAGQPRYENVETAPAIVPEEAPLRAEPPPAPRSSVPTPPVAAPPPPRPRSHVWPIAAALLVGVAFGFAGGYRFGSAQDPGAPLDGNQAAAINPSPTTPIAPPAAAAPPREATEVAVETPRAADAPSERTTSGQAATAPPTVQQPGVAPRAPARATTPPTPQARPRSATRATTAAPSGTAGRFVGRLNVESRPEAARVFLDGRLIGTTPLVVASVPAGEHAIRIELDGYRRWSSSIRIVAAEQNRVTASLER
jgi:serine/threonine-protein kinase